MNLNIRDYKLFVYSYHKTCLWVLKLSSVAQMCLTLAASWTAASQAFLSIIKMWSLLKLVSIESVMPCNHFILCYPLFLLPLIFPCIKVFSTESFFHIKWPKIGPSASVLTMNIQDWFPLRSLPQHHSSEASILQCSAIFMVQLSHPHMTTG